jgi:hypothetical protein
MEGGEESYCGGKAMNTLLFDALQQLNLEPGTYRCELPEHEIVVQVRPRKASDVTPSSEEQSKSKIAEAETIDDSCIMLDPWIELPGPKLIGTVIARFALPSPPDIPEIPTEDEVP